MQLKLFPHLKVALTPTIGEFDPTPAIEHWLRQKERRPGTSGYKDNKK